MITVNGKQIQLTSEMSVADYLEQNNYQIIRNTHFRLIESQLK